MSSYPPLQPVDDNLVGFVGDVERHHTQVGEIPKELWKKNIQLNKKPVPHSQMSLSVTDVLVSLQDTPGSAR